MIKNAITYNVELPNDADNLIGYIGDDDLSTKPDRVSVSGRPGFTQNPFSGEYVTAFDGGYVFTIEQWVKKISNRAVNEELKARIKKLDLQGRVITKAEKQSVKDQIIGEMVGHILPEPKRTQAYYHTDSKMLFVDSSSGKDGDMVCGVLRKAIGSLKATTVYVGQGNNLSSKLIDYLINYNPCFFSRYKPKDKLELYDAMSKTKFSYDGEFLLTDYAQEILKRLEYHADVMKIRLTGDRIKFTLTDNFVLKAIKFDFEDSAYANDSELSKADMWLTEIWYDVRVLVTTMKHLVDELMIKVNEEE